MPPRRIYVSILFFSDVTALHEMAKQELAGVCPPQGSPSTHLIICSLTHATKLGEVLLGSLLLLILIDPLVEVGLEEMEPLGLLEQPGPVLLLELLLLQLDLDVLGGVVDLALRGVDLGVELELDVVLALEGPRGAGEGQRRGLQVELDAVLGDVGDGDGEVDEVLLRLGVGGALGPEDWNWRGG